MNQRYPLSKGVPARLAVVALLAVLLITGGLRATPAFAADPPSVTSLNPPSGSTAGGYSVVVTGTDFTGVTGVTVGGTPVTANVVNDTTITISSMPPHIAETVDVIVTDPIDGPSTATDNFTYLQAPVVSSLSPTNGLVAGGNTVTITGLGFTGATSVSFGGTAAAITAVTATTITVTAPAHAAGTVDVFVTTPVDTSANTIADNYTYLDVPVVSSLTPTTGPIAGGNNVTITGLSLTGALVVTFGGTSTAFVVTGDTSITATAPAHAAGTVDVLVTTAQGTSANTAADDYTYGDLPVVTSLSPTTGPIAGGTVVTITGTGFTGATSVTFGGTAAVITAVTATTITVTAPAHTAGTVDVLVTTPSGTSANTA
ncbi:MAG: IPT/TIG domain-containing protein, partial [Dehalococcoidia bacterium]|nr:IPT/TIG domain-containing protein [Dehalococcoidia bacterium]